MKKYIMILNALELMSKLYAGKRVEGVLFIDENTGSLTFKAYNRKTKHPESKLVKKLPWGWVKESVMRIRVMGSFPKDVGTAKVMSLLDEHTKEAKNALIEHELDLIEFC